FGCRRATVELLSPALGADAFSLAFEIVGGQIEASVEHRGWADKLSDEQRAAFVAALRGLLDMAAADRVYGKERSEEAAPAEGFADLIRRVTWVEWSGRWQGRVVGNKPVA